MSESKLGQTLNVAAASLISKEKAHSNQDTFRKEDEESK
jgi:hypothetical protein